MAHRQIGAFLLCLCLTSLACAAPDEPPRFELSIAADLPLDEALQELSSQTGIQFLFFSQITAGHRAPELSGNYTLDAAVARLLEGTQLTFRYVNARTLEVRETPPRSARSTARARKPDSKLASASHDPMQEVHVVASAEQLVATRVPTPLRDIPQSVSVISSEQIRQQNSVDLGDVMRNAPGIATRRTSSIAEESYSRAFEVTSYHVDGGGALKPSAGPGFDLYEGTPDLSEFDRIEVLRGSDALFNGNSNPGGTVSLVRKRPLRTAALDVSATLGSWNNYRIEVDATGPLVEDGSLRARAVAVYATRDFFFDRAHLDRKKIFGALEYDFTPDASLTVGGSYQRDDSLPLFSGVPLYSDGTDTRFPRRLGLTFDWAYYDTRLGNGYLQFRQTIGDTWSLRINGTAGRTKVDYGYGTFGGFVNKRSGSLGLPTAQFNPRPDRYSIDTFDATLTGRFDGFGMRETIALGVDGSRVDGKTSVDLYAGPGPVLMPVLAFDPANYPDPRGTSDPLISVHDARELARQHGAFVLLQVDLNDRWMVTGGARVASDRFRLSGTLSIGPFEFPPVTVTYRSDRVVTPFGAVLYRINNHFSWYTSYADIYLTPFGTVPLRADGSALGPAHGITLETGIKGAWRDGALNASLAAYRVDQRNLPVPDNSSSGLYCCYSGGTARSKGIELDLDGELAPGWLIGSGYTYNMYTAADGGIPRTSTPRHLLKIWTSKSLSNRFDRWTVGGALRAQTAARGSLFYDCTSGTSCLPREGLSQRPYAVLDLRTAYELSPKWEIALNLNNVLDKVYYLSQSNPVALTAWYGEPRNFTVRVDGKF